MRDNNITFYFHARPIAINQTNLNIIVCLTHKPDVRIDMIFDCELDRKNLEELLNKRCTSCFTGHTVREVVLGDIRYLEQGLIGCPVKVLSMVLQMLRTLCLED